jgi:hypothetical protein
MNYAADRGNELRRSQGRPSQAVGIAHQLPEKNSSHIVTEAASDVRKRRFNPAGTGLRARGRQGHGAGNCAPQERLGIVILVNRGGVPATRIGRRIMLALARGNAAGRGEDRAARE